MAGSLRECLKNTETLQINLAIKVIRLMQIIEIFQRI